MNAPNENEGRVEEQGITIRLVPGVAGGRPAHAEPGTAKPNLSPEKMNHVRWKNETSEVQTVLFKEADWKAIFMGPWHDIIIQPHGYSEWLTIRPDGDTDEHDYGVDPLIPPATRPPVEPNITADP